MKKSILIVLVALFATSAHAQVGAGIKAGVNFANQNFSGGGVTLDTESRTGYHFGAFFDIGSGGMFSVQPEILFSSQGSKFEFMGETNDYKFAYLNIPILLKAEFANIVNVHAGPQFGILANAKMDEEDIKDEFKASDISLAVGAGVNLPMGLVGGVRYTFGLSNIAEDSDGVDVDVKNANLQIYIGLRLFGE